MKVDDKLEHYLERPRKYKDYIIRFKNHPKQNFQTEIQIPELKPQESIPGPAKME